MLSHYNLAFCIGYRDEAYFRVVLAGEFRNPLMRGFWAEVREFRHAVRPPGTPEGAFDALCEEAYQAGVPGGEET
ncbi:DUF6082 family protein [Dactylosporangium sp. McL0621]|uniref:DUF6082 family protein n=1 Tax=Dactylosporangium sp. McL0621 TaxID=3415678 RepID=UPI003CEF0C65